MFGATILPLLPYVALSCIIISYLRDWFGGGVKEIPGPFVAKLTNLYRFLDIYKGFHHVTLNELHDKYGDNVRYGPNMISVRNLNDVNKIYGVKRIYPKSHFYSVQQIMAKGKPTQTLFSTMNETFHSNIRRPVANAYAMSSLMDYEPLVDRTNATFLEQLDRRFVESGDNCPIFTWLQYYAFDVIGEVTCSSNFGFLEGGRDVDDIMASLGHTMDYAGLIGQMPWLDRIFKKNPVWAWMAEPSNAVAQFARRRLNSRLTAIEKGLSDKKESPKAKDLVHRFLQSKMTHPNVVDDNQVFSYMVTNMLAGSDTTAITLRAILYYILKDPRVYAKLMEELDKARESGCLELPATWRQSQQLHYFDCVVKEALRLHPAVGQILERLVPEGGLTLECGTVLPPGTIVGTNPWVIHRNKSLFGDDAESFRPERWIQGTDEDTETYNRRLRVMTSASMAFGKGHRTCIGKNISLLEIYKLIPTLFLTYHAS